MTVTDELKPCPFCGGDDVMVIDADHSGQMSEYSHVHCSDCLANGPLKSSDGQALAAWNRHQSQGDGWQGMETYWAVWSVTGAHVGLWQDRDTAFKVWEDYPGGKILPLFTRPPMTQEHNTGEGVRVKPLRWTKRDHGGWHGWSGNALHFTIEKGVRHWRLYVENQKRYLGAFDIDTEAKHAAQAHFNQQALSCLDLTPSQSTTVGEAVALDGPELFEIIFGAFKGDVPKELTDAKLSEIAASINEAFALTAALAKDPRP